MRTLTPNPEKWRNFDIAGAISGVNEVSGQAAAMTDRAIAPSSAKRTKKKDATYFLTDKPTYKVVEKDGVTTVVKLK